MVQHQDRLLQEMMRDLDVLIQTCDERWYTLKSVRNNRHTVIRIHFEAKEIRAIKVVGLATQEGFPRMEIFEIRAYADPTTHYAKQINLPR